MMHNYCSAQFESVLNTTKEVLISRISNVIAVGEQHSSKVARAQFQIAAGAEKSLRALTNVLPAISLSLSLSLSLSPLYSYTPSPTVRQRVGWLAVQIGPTTGNLKLQCRVS